MAVTLVYLLWINNEGPFEARGTNQWELLQSIGYDPYYFRENGNLITKATCIKNHDHWINQHPEAPKPKERKLKAKDERDLQRKLEGWYR